MSQTLATDNKTLPAEGAEAIAAPKHKTYGEKKFDQMNWLLGYVVTFVATLIPAYYFRDSSKTSWFDKDKSWRQWTADKKEELANSWFKAFEKNEVFNHRAVSSIFVNTTATFAGGFLVLPVIKWMENNKQKIVHHYNEKKGNEAEIAAGDENTKDHKSPSWGALLKGRLGSFAIVFSSFMVLIGLFPKQMDAIEKFGENSAVSIGRKITGKDLGDPNTPKTWAYRLNRAGNLTVFDMFATGASITLTLAISKLGLNKTQEQPIPEAKPQAIAPVAAPPAEAAPTESAPETTAKTHTAEVLPKAKPEARDDYTVEREKEKTAPAGAALVAV